MIRIRFTGRRDQTPSQPDASGSPKRRSALRSGDIIGKTCGIVNRIPKQNKRKTRHSEGRSPVGIPWTGVPIRTPENPWDCHVGRCPPRNDGTKQMRRNLYLQKDNPKADYSTKKIPPMVALHRQNGINVTGKYFF